MDKLVQKKWVNKLCIGTVQFGMKYGINNSSGIPSSSAISQILKIATKNGIDTLDTAHGYGNTELRLGELCPNSFRLISKFSTKNNENELVEELKLSFERLKRTSIYGYLAHSGDTLIENPKMWDVLLKIRDEKKVQKIGYSLYTEMQLEKLLELNFIPDIVQLPYSILDRKFEKYFPALKERNIEIHIRSVFLQGLYYLNPQNLPEKLTGLSEELDQVHRCCLESGVSVGALALNFPLRNAFIDKVIIGVDTPSQLEQNVKAILTWKDDSDLTKSISKIEVEKKELLNPANWN